MSARWTRPLALTLLCLAAGYVDATGYLHQKVFAANMTGNTVLAGMSMAQREWLTALERASTLVTFFAGAAFGGLLLARTHAAARLSLWIEAALLAGACALDPSRPAWLWLIGVAMGLQATIAIRAGPATVSTVVVTSTMARLAESLAACIAGVSKRSLPAGKAPALLAMCWVFYGLGAVLAMLAAPLGAAALAGAAGLVALAALLQ